MDTYYENTHDYLYIKQTNLPLKKRNNSVLIPCGQPILNTKQNLFFNKYKQQVQYYILARVFNPRSCYFFKTYELIL